MKKTILLTVSLIFFFVLSCEKESNELLKTEITVDTISQNDKRGPVQCTGVENYFETQLQWFAYIAAETAAENSAARAELELHLSNNPSNVILAEDLVGPNATLTVFSAKFHETLLPYMCLCDPGSGYGYPPPPPVPGTFPDGTPYSTIADIFYSNMLEENCVEFYFPVGVDFSSGFEITSSSHPLTTNSCNEGFIWEEALGGGEMTASQIVLDQGYVNSNDNIFITRPFRDARLENCPYTEYSGIDFTDFMD